VVARLLERGAHPHAVNKLGANALWAASFSGNAELVRMLLLRGVDPQVATNPGIGEEANTTALDIAQRKGHEKVVALLRNPPQPPKMDAIAATWRAQRQQRAAPAPEEQEEDHDDAPSAAERMHALLFLLAATELFAAAATAAAAADSPITSYLDELDLTVRRWQAMEVRAPARCYPPARPPVLLARSPRLAARTHSGG
jgi:ankyrin repeat protein